MHVVTRADPLFFLLPRLTAAAETGEFLPAAALLRQQVAHEAPGGSGRGAGEAGATSSAAARAHLGYADVGAVLSHHPRLADVLSSVCDVSDVDGTSPAALAYRLDRGKAVGVLADRVRALARQVAQKDVEAAARLKAVMGGFSAASAALPAPSPSAGSEGGSSGSGGGGGGGEESGPPVTLMHLYTGLSVLSDCVADEWVAAVASRLE